MVADVNVFNNLKTELDYQQAQDAHDLQQALQLAHAQYYADRANSIESGKSATGNVPAAIQIANEYQKRIAAGDVEGANQIAQFSKVNPAMLGAAPASVVAGMPTSINPAPLPPVAPMANQQAADTTLGLFAAAPGQAEQPNFQQALANPPKPNAQGVTTLPITDDFAPNPFSSLNGSTGSKTDATKAPVAAQLSGADFLSTLPADRANLVKLIGDGSEKSTTALARLPGAERQSILSQVVQYNPSYSANQFGANKEFGTGKLGNQVRSFNTSIAHLDTMSNLAKDLGNGDIKLFNAAAQRIAAETGEPAPVNFDAARQIVGAEVIKAIVGAGGGVAEREHAADLLSKANSLPQLLGVIGTTKELMKGQLDNLKIQYKDSTGKDNFDTKLSPAAAGVEHGSAPNTYKPTAKEIAAAKKAPDGNFYLPDPTRAGKFLMVKK